MDGNGGWADGVVCEGNEVERDAWAFGHLGLLGLFSGKDLADWVVGLDLKGWLVGGGVEGVVNICLCWLNGAWEGFADGFLHEAEVGVKVYGGAVFNFDEMSKGGLNLFKFGMDVGV